MVIWIATVRGDGGPHLTPVWFVWLDDLVYIATGTDTQKFANLRTNQSVVLSLPDTENVTIIEGEAHAADRKTSDKLAEYFFHKYEWDFRYDDTADWRLVEITPHKILSWGDGYETDGIRLL
jgi:general stress protein 26